MSDDAADSRPWFDSARPSAERLDLLLREMTLEEKAGQLFHAMITAGPGGTLADAQPAFGLPSNEGFIADLKLTHFNLFGAQDAASDIARWHNALQQRARATRLGIPVTISSDPRNHFSDNPGAAILSGPFSQWPEPLGLAATRDADLVARFADIARQEYTAVGIRVALHPQIDLATESRWARQLQTFGEDAELTAELGAAYIRGFQGEHLGSSSVATMTKHFPGGGPQQDGEDPHFEYGREQVYPGGQFDLHLIPFEAAFAAGTSQIMPYYGMPVGTEHDEVGFAFNKTVHHRAAARALRIRRHRVRRLGRPQRPTDHGPPVPRPRLGPRAPDPARAPRRRSRSRCRPVRRRVLSRARRVGGA